MPSSYAHYRFGSLALPQLSEGTRRTIQRFRQLYDVGLHGPDFFFYDKGIFHTKMGELGHQYHQVSGKTFFENAAARLQENPSEGGEAYLFGVLGHYALDSVCHPLVCAADQEGKVGHTELETEFDRVLLEMDGEASPHTRILNGHMHLTWGECVTVAGFYPPATAYTVRRGVTLMSLITRAQSLHNRELVERGFRLTGNSQMVMYSRPNRKCASLIPELTGQFDRALGGFPALAAQLESCIRENAPLGEEFEATFG